MIRFDARGKVDRSSIVELVYGGDYVRCDPLREELADALDVAVAALREIEQRYLIGVSLTERDRITATEALRQIGAIPTAADDT